MQFIPMFEPSQCCLFALFAACAHWQVAQIEMEVTPLDWLHKHAHRSRTFVNWRRILIDATAKA
ncbi:MULTISPECIES: hypothetical protein [Polaromonas]|jgi:putative AlgH/UPF0301 family transcriptional regulator|uniref:hypothetical protein n=1 Tax=Polaromonas TaxID=52972 RepID=UPI0004957AC8|nr:MULTISPECIES: hypothetical protein [Polaromonas]